MKTSPPIPLRLAFAGTPEFARIQLAALHEHSPHTVCGVFTQPDKPTGRGQTLHASPVKTYALAHDIPVFQPKSFKKLEAQQQLKALAPDLWIVAAYGLILPQAALDIPTWGCLNVHASLLPRWRGASPIQQALLAGDPRTGVTILRMSAELDAGPCLYALETPIEASDTSASLHDRLAQLGAQALLTTLTHWPDDQEQAQAQDQSLVTWAPKIEKAHGLLNVQESAAQLERQIRAFYPWPMAYLRYQEDIIRIHAATVDPHTPSCLPGTLWKITSQGLWMATSTGSLVLNTIQLPNKKACSIQAILNGHPQLFTLGARFL